MSSRRDEDHALRVAALRDRNAERGRCGDAGGDAVHDFDRESRRAERGQFLAAAAEHERIAALEPRDAAARAQMHEHRGDDRLLRRRCMSAALADVLDVCIGTRMAQYVGVHEIVDEQHVRRTDRTDGLERQQVGVAGAGADEPGPAHRARHGTHRVVTVEKGRRAARRRPADRSRMTDRTKPAQARAECAPHPFPADRAFGERRARPLRRPVSGLAACRAAAFPPG
jgi:hypothetical protein